MVKTIYANLDEFGRIVEWSSCYMDGFSEIEIDDNHPFFKDRSHSTYVYDGKNLVKNEAIQLNIARKNKDDELSRACNKSILDGFVHEIDGVEYFFSYDIEAQINFSDAKEILEDGMFEEIMWTAKKNGEHVRIPINLERFNQIKLSIFKHKANNISKYRDVLLPKVMSASSVKDINSITWEGGDDI
jgi:hypothetical protein